MIFKVLKVLLILALYALLGFTREYWFESINIKLFFLWRDESDPIMDESLAFLNQYGYWTLYWLKWILTGLFSAFYFLTGLAIVKLFFSDKYLKFVVFAYLLVLGLSILIFGIGCLTGTVNSNYNITRQLMDWLQSPVKMIVLIPGFLLHQKQQAQKTVNN